MPNPADPTASWDVANRPLPATIGRYQIVEQLGAGGMGVVYKAHDPHLGRQVAVKVPRLAPGQDRVKLLERFQREARSAAQVWHPHVCPIYDVGEQDGQPYVVMAYVAGQSLAEHLSRQGRLDPHEAVILLSQVLDALGAIHSHGLVHRDLKPSNILLDPAGKAIVTDFGLARPEAEVGRLTSEGVVVGTPAYMAPEQAAGQPERVGPWTDLYSAGVVFFEMLTGQLPFQGPGALGKLLNESPPPLSRFRPYLDPRLDAVLRKALCKEPEGRFASAAEFAEALASLRSAPATASLNTVALDQRASQPAEASRLARAKEAAGHLPQQAVFLLTGALLLLAGVCLLVGLIARDKDAYVAMLLLLGLGAGVALLGPILRWARDIDLTATNRHGETWLMTAAKRGQAAQVKDLLTRGAEVNEKDRAGQTALMKAAEEGHVAVVRLLLAAGAEVNEKDTEGRTALERASARGHSAVVEVLASAGATE